MSDSLFNQKTDGLLAQQKAGDNAQELTVSEISSSLKKMVEDRFGYVKIRGEISGFKRATSGHCYFGLKDDKALIDGVMWKGSAARLPFAAEDGLEVVASGKITTYPGRSKYQIVVDSMALAGEGALMALFEKIKARLNAEGLFDPARRKTLPYLPRTIGIITSPTGSVIRDMLHRLSDRFPVHVIVWPTIVQGEGAAAKIAAAVNGFNALQSGGTIARPDLLIVARGGGSIEDLWAFNEEEVVRAVAASTIPIISAVGHETDTTLCDYAADLRAPTPTAAAEMAVPVRDDLLYTVDEYRQRADNMVRRIITQGRERLEAQRRLMPKLSEITAPHQQRADDLSERLKHALSGHIGASQLRLAGPSGSLKVQILNRIVSDKKRQLDALRLSPLIIKRGIDMRNERLKSLRFGPHLIKIEQGQDRLSHIKLSPALANRPMLLGQEKLDALWRLAENLHPDRPLSKGFARITNKEGATLTSAKTAQSAKNINLHFADGMVEAITDITAEMQANIATPQKNPKKIQKITPKKPSPQQDDLFS